MAQISAGHNYTPTGANSLVTASNLNQHVNNAQLSGGAVSEQTLNSASADTDLLLIGKGGNIFKQTKLQFTDAINSSTINVNGLSVDAAEIDTLNISQTLDGPNARLFDAGWAIMHSNKSDGVRIGYNGAYFTSRPAGVVDLQNFLVTAKNFTFTNTNLSGAATATIDAGNLYVNETGGLGGNIYASGNIYSGGEQVMTGASVAAKTGQCGIFGITVLHKTQEFEIPDDETWVFTFLAHWTTGQIGNTRPDGYYDVTASLEKSGYSDDVIQTWTKVFPSYGALCFINVVVPLTRTDMSSLAKRLKFVNTNGVAGYSWYSITLQKVKTAAFTASSSIL